METSPNHDTVFRSSDTPNGIAAEQPLPTPHFDEQSIQRARPAVPLAQIKARLLWLVIVLMFSSALLGGVIGLTISQQQNRSDQVSTPATSVAPEESRVSTGSGDDHVVKSTQEASAPPSQSVAEPEEKANDAQLRTAAGNVDAKPAADPRDNSVVDAESVTDTQGDDARAALNGALNEWIAATNARDIQRQMNFYNQKVNAFYLTRNVPREAVLAEKSRVFGRAELIDIKAAAPGIRLSRDGRTATMRFRKKYAIEGGGEDRRGEVVQELRWRRTDDGWKIVSERDLRVIN